VSRLMLPLVLVLRVLSRWRSELAVWLRRRGRVLVASLWQALVLQGCSLCFDKSVLDRPHDLRWEDGTLVQGARHGFFPSLEHAFHGSAYAAVDQSVGVHERAVQAFAEIDRVGSAYVLHNRVQDVECGQLLRRRCLFVIVSITIYNKSGKSAGWHVMLHNIINDLVDGNLTVLMWVSSVFEMT
jgi:hypothetical protein